MERNQEYINQMVEWPGVRAFGWSGETCSKCGATINIVAGGGAWICETCGSCNVLSYSFHQMPHKTPDYGPTDKQLRIAYKQSPWWKKWRQHNQEFNRRMLQIRGGQLYAQANNTRSNSANGHLWQTSNKPNDQGIP